jgi:hypothetical protein
MRNRKLRHIRSSGCLLTGSGKVTWPEEALTGTRVCACPVFPRVFFLVVTWLPAVMEIWPFWVPLGVRMHNRKLCKQCLLDTRKALSGSRFCACPAFPRVFFLVVVTWLRKVAWSLGYAHAQPEVAQHPQWPKVTWSLRKCPWGVLYDVHVLKL